MATLDLSTDEMVEDVVPLVFVMSDARGETANVVVRAAAAQFDKDAIEIVRLANADSLDKVKDFLEEHVDDARPMAVFYTFSDKNLRRDVRSELNARGIPSIDLLGPAINVLSTLTGEEPSNKIGALRDQLSAE